MSQIQTDYHQDNFQQNERDKSPIHDEDTIIGINQYQQDNNIVPDQLDNWYENVFQNEDKFQHNINSAPISAIFKSLKFSNSGGTVIRSDPIDFAHLLYPILTVVLPSKYVCRH